MKLTVQEAEAFRLDSRKLPLQVLAQRRGSSVFELCAAARRSGIALEIQPIEIQHILECIESKPATRIREDLGLTLTQFQQVLARFGLRSSKAAAQLALTEVVAKTRWLVQTALNARVDDELPRQISGDHFVKHGLYNLIVYGTKQKEAHERFRGFPAAAYLVCVAYPGLFQPFQFRHAKGKTPFKGRDGKRRVIDATRWIVEEKLGLRVELLEKTAHSKYFMRNADLQFYGIPPNTYRKFFKTQDELIDALLKSSGVSPSHDTVSSVALRAIMEKAGRPPVACEVAGCTAPKAAGIDIHHVVPKSTRAVLNLHAAPNLVALCPNHHRAAGDYPWGSRLGLSMDERRAELLEILSR